MSSPPGVGVFVTITNPLPNASVSQIFTVSGSFGPPGGTLTIETDDGSGIATGPTINGSDYSFKLKNVNFGTRTVTVTLDAGGQGSASASVTVTVTPDT